MPNCLRISPAGDTARNRLATQAPPAGPICGSCVIFRAIVGQVFSPIEGHSFSPK